ncbi:MAG: DUF1499 domain-containing protein [Spirochaetaceae bacterium]
MGMIVLFSLVIAFVVGFFALQIWGRTAPPPADLGTVDGNLRPCPDTPNCVETRAADDEHAIAPLEIPQELRRHPDTAGAALDRLNTIIAAYPRAQVTERRSDYLAAEFRSRIFRFADDVEFLVDEEAGVVHFRSASRLGHSDAGVNRSRMEQIRELWNERAGRGA